MIRKPSYSAHFCGDVFIIGRIKRPFSVLGILLSDGISAVERCNLGNQCGWKSDRCNWVATSSSGGAVRLCLWMGTCVRFVSRHIIYLEPGLTTTHRYLFACPILGWKAIGARHNNTRLALARKRSWSSNNCIDFKGKKLLRHKVDGILENSTCNPQPAQALQGNVSERSLSSIMFWL